MPRRGAKKSIVKAPAAAAVFEPKESAKRRAPTGSDGWEWRNETQKVRPSSKWDWWDETHRKEEQEPEPPEAEGNCEGGRTVVSPNTECDVCSVSGVWSEFAYAE
eukprot:3635670-Amphidinium_carterae.1